MNRPHAIRACAYACIIAKRAISNILISEFTSRFRHVIYSTQICTFVCPPHISETVADKIMKLAHRPRIASITNKLISKQILLSILSIVLKKTIQRISAGPKRRSSPPFVYGDSADFVSSLGHPAPGSGKTLSL